MYTLSQPKLNIRSLRCDTSSPHIFKIYKYIAHKICQSQCAAIFASLIARPYVFAFAFVFVCTRFISHSVALTPNYSFRIDWCSVLALCVSSHRTVSLFFFRKKKLILFPLLFLDLPIAFAALSNGFIIHLVRYTTDRPPKNTVRCLPFFSLVQLHCSSKMDILFGSVVQYDN